MRVRACACACDTLTYDYLNVKLACTLRNTCRLRQSVDSRQKGIRLQHEGLLLVGANLVDVPLVDVPAHAIDDFRRWASALRLDCRHHEEGHRLCDRRLQAIESIESRRGNDPVC